MVNISQGNMTGSDVIKTCRKLADIGIQQVIFNMPNVHDITPLDVFGEEIIPSTIDF